MAKRIHGAHIAPYRTEKGTRWRVRWREHGHHLSQSFGTENAARTYARQVGTALDVHSLIRDHTTTPGEMSACLVQYIETLTARCRKGAKHPHEVQATISRWQQAQGWTRTTDIDHHALESVVTACGRNRCTARKTVIMIKGFLRWAQRQKFTIDTDALLFKAPKHVHAESIAWTEEEVELIITACSRPNHAEVIPSGIGTGRGSPPVIQRAVATRQWRVRQCLLPMIHLMLRYGPRPVETTRLRVADWNPRTSTLSMPGAITKNGHPRSFVVDKDTAAWLNAAASTRLPTDIDLQAVHARRPGAEPLFRNRSSQAWAIDGFLQALKRLIDTAGVPGTPYTFRHTACTRLCRIAQGDLALVRSISGHRTLSELQKYLHITADRQRQIADAYLDLSASPTRAHWPTNPSVGGLEKTS